MNASRWPSWVGSLRATALLMVLTVVASPLVFVLASNAVELVVARRTEGRSFGAAEEAAAALDAAGAHADHEAAIDAIARAYGQRIRVVGLPEGNVVYDRDYMASNRWTLRLGDLIYGPDRLAALAALDATEGPILERPEAAYALAHDGGERCEHVARGNLEVCSAARRARLGAGGALVYAQGSSRRALQTLYEARRELFTLTLFVLVLGLFLSAWMGRRMVGPIERLRGELLTRARAAVPRADLTVVRTDEVGDLAAAFNTLVGALGDRARANEAFLADLAHELKNPVASVRACAERLADGPAPDEARSRRLGEVLRTSAVRLDALVTQFLELARAESGLPDEGREPVDVAALARGLAGAFDVEGRRPTIAVVAPEDGVACTVGVPSRIESVLRNLLDNALSFSNEDGVIRVAIDADHAGITIAVTDSGPGIAEADLPRVFDRFFTTRGAEHRDGRGTGLGLALTRAVVEAHGGRVHAESLPGEGATFVVHLPPLALPR